MIFLHWTKAFISLRRVALVIGHHMRTVTMVNKWPKWKCHRTMSKLSWHFLAQEQFFNYKKIIEKLGLSLQFDPKFRIIIMIEEFQTMIWKESFFAAILSNVENDPKIFGSKILVRITMTTQSFRGFVWNLNFVKQ